MVRLWRKGNPNTLLVGMQTGATTVENSMEFPQKTKNGTACWELHCLVSEAVTPMAKADSATLGP